MTDSADDRMPMIAELVEKLNAACVGYDNTVVISALMSLGSAAISRSSKTLPEAMWWAGTSGMMMVENIRDNWDDEDHAEPQP